jgi:hypothetical protein
MIGTAGGSSCPMYARSEVTGVCGTIAFTRSSNTVTRIAVRAPKLWPATPSRPTSAMPCSGSLGGMRERRLTR